jgi:hypothetical protein
MQMPYNLKVSIQLNRATRAVENTQNISQVLAVTSAETMIGLSVSC